MTNSSAIYGKPPRRNTAGIKFTGSCGYERLVVFARHSRSPTNNCNRTALVFVRNFFEKELVGPFRLESTARVVSSPMSSLKGLVHDNAHV